MSTPDLSFNNLSDLQNFLIGNGVPFASFRLPGDSEPHTLISDGSYSIHSSVEEVFDQSPGFVMAPFFRDEPLLYFRNKFIIKGFGFHPFFLVAPKANTDLPASDFIPDSKSSYIRMIDNTVQRIKSGEAAKVVISRILETEKLSPSELSSLFSVLCESNPHAFVYVAHFPGQGLWAGASPELLLNASNGKVATIALAGTRKSGETGEWGQKEKDEQEWVSRFIGESMTEAGCSNVQVSETRTVSAGNVEHLLTEFHAFAEDNIVPLLIDALHPTPAVCGWPKQDAYRIIRETETYKRSYYTGFLGPVEGNGKTSLFVNLRCLQVLEDKTLIYAGGGITAASDPASEWEETELKSRNILSAIEKLRNLASESEIPLHEK
jgi:isochorismate synthase